MLRTNSNVHKFGLQVPTPVRSATLEAAQQINNELDFSLEYGKNISTKHMYDIPVNVDETDGNCIFSLAFSENTRYLAASLANGLIFVYDSNGRFCWKLDSGDSNRFPVTVCTWRPTSTALPSSCILVSGSVNGDIFYWHCTSQRIIYQMTEEDNQIYTLSYRPDGMRLATAGKDFTVRVYDEETKALVSSFSQGILHHSGHSNRIFASKWKPDDENVLLTGGWDNSVMIWDLRMKIVARSFYGPHIAGEALDIQNDSILTGSYRADNTLETWDFGSGKCITSFSGVGMIYTAKYLSDREGFCVAGGTGLNELRVHNVNDSMHKSTAITISGRDGNKAGIYTADVSGEKQPRIAVGGGSNCIRVCVIADFSVNDVLGDNDKVVLSEEEL